jgi:hypothetical protein
VAATRIAPGLEAKITHRFTSTQGRSGDDHPDQGDGRQQPVVGCRPHAWSAAETGYQRRKADDPALDAPDTTSAPTWSEGATFLRNHANDIGAGDVLPITDIFFRPLLAFVSTARGSRRIIHVGVTRSPTAAWGAQQVRAATPVGEAPTYLSRDAAATYGSDFNAMAMETRIPVLGTPCSTSERHR